MINPQEYCIFCDFDGTISLRDTVNSLLDKHAIQKWVEIENIWKQGLIGSKECMERQLQCIPSISQSQFDNFIDSMETVLGFEDFMKRVKDANVDFYIVSDGFSTIINKVLAKNNIFDVNVIASEVNLIENKLIPKFPHECEDCLVRAGNCKCRAIDKFRQNRKVIYIGDGHSDTCAVKKADYIFAKKELAQHCEKNSIEYKLFENFTDITEALFEVKEKYVNR